MSQCRRALLSTGITLIGSFVMSVCPYVTTRRILMKSGIYVFILIMSRKLAFHQNLIRTTDTLHEDQYTILYISHSILLE